MKILYQHLPVRTSKYHQRQTMLSQRDFPTSKSREERTGTYKPRMLVYTAVYLM